MAEQQPSASPPPRQKGANPHLSAAQHAHVSVDGELRDLEAKIGMLGQAFNVRTITGRRFAHVQAARLQQAKKVEERKKEMAILEDADAARKAATQSTTRFVGANFLVPIVHKFDPGQAALRYRRKVAPRILIVDDNKLHVAASVLTLKKNFEDVFFATNGRQALEIMEHQPIDVIIVDAVMPIMDGAEMTDIVRYTEETAGARDFRILIIGMVTQEQSRDDNLMDDLFLSGMDRYIVKPFPTHLKSVSQILCIEGASVEGFRRKVLEQQLVSTHDDLRAVLTGSEEERKKREDVVAVADREVKREKEVLQFFREDEKFSIEDLFARQRREDTARMQLNAARMRDRIRELEAQLNDARAVNDRLTENRQADKLLAMERRTEGLIAELDEAKLENSRLAEQNRLLNLDLKNLLSNGFANEKKVRAAERRSAMMHYKMARVEARMMALEDRNAMNAWSNYYGRVENRSCNWAPPALATDLTGSWYHGLLERVTSITSQHARTLSTNLDTVEQYVSRSQNPAASLEGVRSDAVITLREYIADAEQATNTLSDHVNDFVAQFLTRELQFWKLAMTDDPTLPSGIREIVSRIDDRTREHLVNSQETQTDFEEVEAIDFGEMDPTAGDNGKTFMTATGSSDPDLVVVPVLERLAPLLRADSFVPTHVRRESVDEALRVAKAIEEKRYNELLRTVQELRREVGHGLEKVDDPQKEVKLQPVLSSIRPHSFFAIRDSILDICDNIQPALGLAVQTIPKGVKVVKQAADARSAATGGLAGRRTGPTRTTAGMSGVAAAKSTASALRGKTTSTRKVTSESASPNSLVPPQRKTGTRTPVVRSFQPRHGPAASPSLGGGRPGASSRSGKGTKADRTAQRASIRHVHAERALKAVEDQLARARALLQNAANAARPASDGNSPSQDGDGVSTLSGTRIVTGETEAFARAAILAQVSAKTIEVSVGSSGNTGAVPPVQMGSAFAGFTVANVARITRTSEEDLREANPELPELASGVIDGHMDLMVPVSSLLMEEVLDEARATTATSDKGDDDELAEDEEGQPVTLVDLIEITLENMRKSEYEASGTLRSAAGTASRHSIVSEGTDDLTAAAEEPADLRPAATVAVKPAAKAASPQRALSTTTSSTPGGGGGLQKSATMSSAPKASTSKAAAASPASTAAAKKSKSMQRVSKVSSTAEATINHQVYEPMSISEIARLFGASEADILRVNDEYLTELFGEPPTADMELDSGDRIKIPITASQVRKNLKDAAENRRPEPAGFLVQRGQTPQNMQDDDGTPRASAIAPVALDAAVVAAMEQMGQVTHVKHFAAAVELEVDGDDGETETREQLPTAAMIAKMYDTTESVVLRANPGVFAGPDSTATEGAFVDVPVVTSHLSSMLEEEKEALHDKIALLTAEAALLEAEEREEEAVEARAELDAAKAVIGRHRGAIAVLQSIDRQTAQPQQQPPNRSPAAAMSQQSAPKSDPAALAPLSSDALRRVGSGEQLKSLSSSKSMSHPAAKTGGGPTPTQRTPTSSSTASSRSGAAGGGGKLTARAQSMATRSRAVSSVDTSGRPPLSPRKEATVPTAAGGTTPANSSRKSAQPAVPSSLPQTTSPHVEYADEYAASPSDPPIRQTTMSNVISLDPATPPSATLGAPRGSSPPVTDAHDMPPIVTAASGAADDGGLAKSGGTSPVQHTSSDFPAGGANDLRPDAAASTPGALTAGDMAQLRLQHVESDMVYVDSGPSTAQVPPAPMESSDRSSAGRPHYDVSAPLTPVQRQSVTPHSEAEVGGIRAIDATDGAHAMDYVLPPKAISHIGPPTSALAETVGPAAAPVSRTDSTPATAVEPAEDAGKPATRLTTPDAAPTTPPEQDESAAAAAPSSEEPAVDDPASKMESSAVASQALMQNDDAATPQATTWSPPGTAEDQKKPKATPPAKRSANPKVTPPATRGETPSKRAGQMWDSANLRRSPEAPVVSPGRTPEPSRSPPPAEPTVVSFSSRASKKAVLEPSALRQEMMRKPKPKRGVTPQQSAAAAAESAATSGPMTTITTPFATQMQQQGVTKQAPRASPSSKSRVASPPPGDGRNKQPAIAPALALGGAGVRPTLDGFTMVGAATARSGPNLLSQDGPATATAPAKPPAKSKTPREAAKIFHVPESEQATVRSLQPRQSRTGSPDAAAGATPAMPVVSATKLADLRDAEDNLLLGGAGDDAVAPHAMDKLPSPSRVAKLPPVSQRARQWAQEGDARPPAPLAGTDSGPVAMPLAKPRSARSPLPFSLARDASAVDAADEPRRLSPLRAPQTLGALVGDRTSGAAAGANATLTTVRLDPRDAPPVPQIRPRPPPFGDLERQRGDRRRSVPPGELVERLAPRQTSPVDTGPRVTPRSPLHPESARRPPVVPLPKSGRESPPRAPLNLPSKRVNWNHRFHAATSRTASRRAGASRGQVGSQPPPTVDRESLKAMFDKVALGAP